MKVMILSMLSLFTVANEARLFERCELAGVLRRYGLDGFGGYTLNDWICLLSAGGGFSTNPPVIAMGMHRYYGLFRIDNRYFCSDGTIASRNVCNMHCQRFLDDNLTDDIACVKTIVQSQVWVKTWIRATFTSRCSTRRQFFLGSCGF